jgi:hypothetical protein
MIDKKSKDFPIVFDLLLKQDTSDALTYRVCSIPACRQAGIRTVNFSAPLTA